MKKHYITYLFLLFTVFITAQEWEQEIIRQGDIGSLMKSIDLDVDNDVDIVTYDGRFYWYANLDGEGDFAHRESRSAIVGGVMEFQFHDIDGDQYQDILYRTYDDEIYWMENEDGLGQFGPPNLIFEDLTVYDIEALDVDQDNDLDVVAILYFDVLRSQVVWFENTDSNGTFGSEQHLEAGFFDECRCLRVMDVNEDQLDDLVTVLWGGTNLIYFPNDPDGSFSTSELIHHFSFFQSDWPYLYKPGIADLDGNGHEDIYFISQYLDFPFRLRWLPNYGGGNFGDPMHIAELGFDIYEGLDAADLDGDLDMDLMIAITSQSANEDGIYWFPNADGYGNFGEIRTISTAVDFVQEIGVANIDTDERPDPISLSQGDDKLAWYPNTGVLSVDDFRVESLKLYPNPAQDKVFVETTLPLSKVRLVNALGQAMDIDIVQGSVDVSALDSGIYLLEATFDNGQTQVHRLLIR